MPESYKHEVSEVKMKRARRGNRMRAKVVMMPKKGMNKMIPGMC